MSQGDPLEPQKTDGPVRARGLLWRLAVLPVLPCKNLSPMFCFENAALARMAWQPRTSNTASFHHGGFVHPLLSLDKCSRSRDAGR